jgi:hypothetical protein
MELSPLKKVTLIIKNHLVEVSISPHDFVVYWTCHQGDTSTRILRAEGTKERDNAEHVTQLIVLTHNQDTLNAVSFRGRRYPRSQEKPEKS